MRLWTSAALGAAAVVACATPAVAQTAGCATCGNKPLAGPVPNTIPHCSKHTGLTQYPLSEKRYIKQFCNPTICPNSCFGHFKTQWTAWPQACPGWPQEGVAPANFGPNFVGMAPPAEADRTPSTPTPAPAPAATTTPPVPPVPTPMDPPPAPPSKPLDLPPSKPAAAPTTPPAVQLPGLPPAGTPGKL